MAGAITTRLANCDSCGRTWRRTAVDSPVTKAALSVEIAEDPRGPMKMDDLGNPIENVYVRKVERVGGKLQNTVIHTYPNVSQFWTYKQDEYLKAPAYDRNYPPCKFCE